MDIDDRQIDTQFASSSSRKIDTKLPPCRPPPSLPRQTSSSPLRLNFMQLYRFFISIYKCSWFSCNYIGVHAITSMMRFLGPYAGSHSVLKITWSINQRKSQSLSSPSPFYIFPSHVEFFFLSLSFLVLVLVMMTRIIIRTILYLLRRMIILIRIRISCKYKKN